MSMIKLLLLKRDQVSHYGLKTSSHNPGTILKHASQLSGTLHQSALERPSLHSKVATE